MSYRVEHVSDPWSGNHVSCPEDRSRSVELSHHLSRQEARLCPQDRGKVEGGPRITPAWAGSRAHFLTGTVNTLVRRTDF